MRRGKLTKIVELLVIVAIVLGVRMIRPRADALGTIEGTVMTSGGAALSGATVGVSGNNASRTASTDGSGHFSISGLSAGTYKVIVAASGYRSTVTSVAVAAGATASVKLSLAPNPVKKEPAKPAEGEVALDKPDPVSRHISPKPPAPAYYRGSAPRPPLVMPSPTAQAIEQDPAMNTEGYSKIDDNPFFRSQTTPLSTFSVDVDTASYSNMRRFLHEGSLPPKDAVRIEELINYFHYDYPTPPKDQPFSITTEVGPSPWNAKLQLARIGIKAPPIDDAKVPARNLVFLIDVSGSMMTANKLPLLKRSLGLLVEQLRPEDKVAMVVYAGNTGLALPSTTGREKSAIRSALVNLEAGGSTNGGAGIQLAYEVAAKNFLKGGITA
jgi:Ca-activated chloride channel family protein